MKQSIVVKYLGGVALAGLLAAMAITNPSQAAYNEFATRTLSSYLQREVCAAPKDIPELLDTLVSSGCSWLVASQQAKIEQYLAANTQRQNLIFLSLYTTDLPTHRIKTVGILQKFFIFQGTEKY